jgi:hypothetical protein
MLRDSQMAIVGERMLRYIRERASGQSGAHNDLSSKRHRNTITSTNGEEIGFGSAEWDEDHVCGDDEETDVGGVEAMLPPPAGGASAIDILVTTPGRLMEHLDNTPGFTLQHLQIMVVDEVRPRVRWVHRCRLDEAQ